MKVLARALTRLALVVTLLIPVAALAGGPGRGAGRGHTSFGRSTGSYGAGSFHQQRATRFGERITARRRLQVKLDGLEIRRTTKRLAEEASIRQSGSLRDVERYARRAKQENALDDFFLREELRRDFFRKRATRPQSVEPSWGLRGLSSRRLLSDALDRRRLREDIALNARTQALARDVAWRERVVPQLPAGDARPGALRRVLTFMGY